MLLRRFLFALIAAFAISAHAAELRIGLAADVTSLDPHYLNVAPNNNAAWHLFDALVHVDANARLVPGLAVSWRAVDPNTWEFKLRKGVKFQDGSEFTAEDVIFSLERAATLAASPGPFASFVKPITAKKIIDPWTIRLKTAAPYAMLPYDLNSIFIVSKKAATGASPEDFNSGQAAVGTCPPIRRASPRCSQATSTRSRTFPPPISPGSRLTQISGWSRRFPGAPCYCTWISTATIPLT